MTVPAPSKSSNKKTFWLIGAILATVATVTLLSPSLVSSSWGKERLISLLNKRVNGQVSIDELSLSWFGGQHVVGVQVRGADSIPILTIDKAQTDASLLPLIFGYIPGESLVDGLSLNIIPYGDGTTNIDYLLKKVAEPSKAQQLPAIKVEDVHASGGSSPALNLHLKGKTLVDSSEGTFNVNVVSLEGSGDIKVEADVARFPVLVLDQIVAMKSPNLKGALVKMLGNTLNINVSQVFEGGKSAKDFSLYKLLLNIVSDKARITLESNSDSGDNQVALNFAVDGIQATPLLFKVDENVTLVNPTTIQVEISSEAVEKLSGKSLPFQWRATTPAQVIVNEFKSKYPLSEVLSSSLQAAIEIQNVVLLSIPGLGDVEIINATLESKTTEIRNAHVHLHAEVRVLQPSGAFAQIAAEPFALDLSGDVHLEEDGASTAENITLTVKNSKVALDMQGRLTSDQRLVMSAPATINWSGGSAGLVLSVQPLELSLANPKIENLKASLRTDVHSEDLFTLDWSSHTQTLIAQGAFDGFPIGRISPELEGLFGPSLNGSLLVSIKEEGNGPVKMSLKGSNGSVSLDGRCQNGVLLLNKPVEGQFQANEKLGRTLFRRAMPILSGLISADNPITVNVDTAGFALPLFPFSLEKTTVGLATLDFGSMQFRNAGALAKVLSALRPGGSPTLSLWFTPLYVHLNQGILNVERVDLLMQGRYPLAAWGNVDLNRELVDMQIGLSAITIAHAFNVKVGDPNAYIAVPLRGSLQDPTLDKTSATAKIASLAALNQAGAPGMILGTVLHIASGSPSSGEIPPPTTDPLPWAGQLQYESAETDGPVTVPVKAVTEGAGKLLKSLFR